MSRRASIAVAVACALLAAAPDAAHATAAPGGLSYHRPHHHHHRAAKAKAKAADPGRRGTNVAGSAGQVRPSTADDGGGATTSVPAATLGADGLATAPPAAPAAVVAVIAAANQIATLPYRYGGGHGSFEDTAYDCSGSVSYALHGGGLLDATLDSTGLGRWGERGPGTWITVYGNKVHAWMVVAGLRFDTSGRTADGSRWQAEPRSAHGFRVRHPAGL